MPKHREKQKQERLQTLQFVDADAAIQLLPISKRSYYNYCKAGLLPSFRIGGNGKLVVRREDLEALVTKAPRHSDLDRLVDETVAKVLGGRK